MEQFRRGLRALRYAWWAIRSFVVLSWYRLSYAGISVGRGVRLGRGVYISVVRGGTLDLGNHVHIDSYSYLTVVGALTIGPRSYIGVGCTLVAQDRITVGQDALIAAYVTLRDQDHEMDRSDAPYREQGLVASPISIGQNVWIGTKATVLRGCSIGDNCVVGANAVVTKDIEGGRVAVGVPARVVRKFATGPTSNAGNRGNEIARNKAPDS